MSYKFLFLFLIVVQILCFTMSSTLPPQHFKCQHFTNTSPSHHRLPTNTSPTNSWQMADSWSTDAQQSADKCSTVGQQMPDSWPVCPAVGRHNIWSKLWYGFLTFSLLHHNNVIKVIFSTRVSAHTDLKYIFGYFYKKKISWRKTQNGLVLVTKKWYIFTLV